MYSIKIKMNLFPWRKKALDLIGQKRTKATWLNPRRLRNPGLDEQREETNLVESGKLRRKRLIYVCGLGATGSLGLPFYYKPEKNDLEDLGKSDVMATTFRRHSLISPLDKIEDISCGYGFTVIAAQVHGSSHTALGFGLNHHSQLGYQARDLKKPLEIVAKPAPIFLPTYAHVSRVSCGRSHTVLMDKTGQVFSIGNNSMGQCGRPIITNEDYFGSKTVHHIKQLPKSISQVECGQDHSMFLATDGSLFACGWGADGQTGLGHYNNQAIPDQVRGDIQGVKIIKVSACADTVLALDNDGNVFGWGNTEYSQFRTLANCEMEQFNVPRHLKLTKIPGKIIDIAAGGTVCAVLTNHGQLYVWGFGLLGQGPNVDQSSKPILIPETLFGSNTYNPKTKVENIYAGLSHFAAITNDGDLYMWGKNRGKCLGLAHGMDQYFPLKVNMNLGQVRKVALGVDHTCAIVEKVC